MIPRSAKVRQTNLEQCEWLIHYLQNSSCFSLFIHAAYTKFEKFTMKINIPKIWYVLTLLTWCIIPYVSKTSGLAVALKLRANYAYAKPLELES